MAKGAEATIVSELFKFAETGQLYRGAKPVMWSPVEKTALAEAEIEYEDIVSTQIDVAFEIVESPIPELVGAYAVIWTTTRWTIPVHRAIAYGAEVEYVIYSRQDFDDENSRRNFLIACDLREAFSVRIDRALGQQGLWASEFFLKGSDLAGTIARHPKHKLGGF